MSARIGSFIRHNLLGLVAIFIALGGTAYATHPSGANTISTGDIIDGQVQNADLGSSAVTGAKVFPSTLNGSDVAPGGLTGSDIAADSLASSDIGPSAVGSSEVADGSLGTAEVATSIPAARLTRTSGQGIPFNTTTALNFNSERYDTASMHSTSSNLSRLTAPVTGIYEVSAHVNWANFNGVRHLRLRKNGTTVVASQSAADAALHTDTQSISSMARLAAGDYVEAVVAHQSFDVATESIDQTPEYSPEFSMTWLAPGP